MYNEFKLFVKKIKNHLKNLLEFGNINFYLKTSEYYFDYKFELY